MYSWVTRRKIARTEGPNYPVRAAQTVDAVVAKWIPVSLALLACACTPARQKLDVRSYDWQPSSAWMTPVVGQTVRTFSPAISSEAQSYRTPARPALDVRRYDWDPPESGWIKPNLPATATVAQQAPAIQEAAAGCYRTPASRPLDVRRYEWAPAWVPRNAPKYSIYANPIRNPAITQILPYFLDDPGHASAAARVLAAGADHLYELLEWSAVEATSGSYTNTLIDRLVTQSGTADLWLNIAVVNTDGAKHTPSDLLSTAWDDPAMLTAFNNFLDNLHSRTGNRLVKLFVGNEADFYFTSDPTQITPFATFLASARTHARTLFDLGRFQIGTTFTQAACSHFSDYAAILSAEDVAPFTYYFLSGNSYQTDLAAILAAVQGKPWAFQEIGFTTDTPVWSQSQAVQNALLVGVFALTPPAAGFQGLNWFQFADYSTAVLTDAGYTTPQLEFFTQIGLRDTNNQPKTAWPTMVALLGGVTGDLPVEQTWPAVLPVSSLSYRTAARAALDVRGYEWSPRESGWIKATLPATGPTVAQTAPAWSTQSQIRTAPRSAGDLFRAQTAPQTFGVPDDWITFVPIQDDGGRTADRKRLDVRSYEWSQPAWITVNLPVVSTVTVAQAWPAVLEGAGLSYRTPGRVPLDVRTYDWAPAFTWVQPVTDASTARLSAIAGSELAGTRTTGRALLDVRVFEWQPQPAWIVTALNPPAATVAQQWPAILQALGLSYRTGARPVLDVRRFDWTPEQGWIARVVDTTVATWTPVFVSSTGRLPERARRVSADPALLVVTVAPSAGIIPTADVVVLIGPDDVRVLFPPDDVSVRL